MRRPVPVEPREQRVERHVQAYEDRLDGKEPLFPLVAGPVAEEEASPRTLRQRLDAPAEEQLHALCRVGRVREDQIGGAPQGARQPETEVGVVEAEAEAEAVADRVQVLEQALVDVHDAHRRLGNQELGGDGGEVVVAKADEVGGLQPVPVRQVARPLQDGRRRGRHVVQAPDRRWEPLGDLLDDLQRAVRRRGGGRSRRVRRVGTAEAPAELVPVLVIHDDGLPRHLEAEAPEDLQHPAVRNPRLLHEPGNAGVPGERQRAQQPADLAERHASLGLELREAGAEGRPGTHGSQGSGGGLHPASGPRIRAGRPLTRPGRRVPGFLVP